MTRWSVRILFASALVLAFVGGEWHGRRVAPERIVVQPAQRPVPDRMFLEDSCDGVDWRECDEDGCAKRYRRVRVIHPDGRVVVTAFVEFP